MRTLASRAREIERLAREISEQCDQERLEQLTPQGKRRRTLRIKRISALAREAWLHTAGLWERS